MYTLANKHVVMSYPKIQSIPDHFSNLINFTLVKIKLGRHAQLLSTLGWNPSYAVSAEEDISKICQNCRRHRLIVTLSK